jgi:SAM-dependent methyltransferase
MLLGNVDTADRFAVSGWAMEPELRDANASVVILIDGERAAEVVCDVVRSDLRSVIGRPDGRCGFVYRFPEPLSDDVGHWVAVRLARTGELLPNGERAVPAAEVGAQPAAVPEADGAISEDAASGGGMDPALREALAALPGLSAVTPAEQRTTCKVCGHKAELFDIVDFNKVALVQDCHEFGFAGIQVPYHRCGNCGFLFTRFFDRWTPEDFGAFIYNADYGKADPEYTGDRPRRMADQMAGTLAQCRGARILDYGSGSGAFAEAMQARGFARIESYDPFSHPRRPDGRFEIITCFEVVEHTPSPRHALEDMQSFLSGGGVILFTQNLQPAEIEQLRCRWWYAAPRNGHISTFTGRTLAVLAEQTGMVFHRGEVLHALRAPNPSTFATRALTGMGQPFAGARLTADAAATGAQAWHAVEGPPHRRYRWTAASEITWPVTLPVEGACLLRVELPFVNEVVPGFAAQCRLAVNDRVAATRIEGHVLVAEVEIAAEGAARVTLRTPQPRSPAELRGTDDDRVLGLAVAVAVG